jgi:Uma2 family endonuclease
MTTLERIGMSLPDFLSRYDQQPFELIDGEMTPIMSPKVFGSDYTAYLLQTALQKWGVGFVFVETTFILPETPEGNWVKGSRQPDVLYLAKDRLDAYRHNTPDWMEKPLMLVPDLAIEVVSPTDRLPAVWRKVAIYLEDGVRLVWVVNPIRESITVFAADDAPFTLSADQTLSGGDVLPGFQFPLSSLFKK